jgi:hypothetical protein
MIFKRRKFDMMKIAFIVIIIILTMTAAFFLKGISDHGDNYDEARLKTIRSAIYDALVTCYALEGGYPFEIDHLADNYGLIIDRSRYIYHYEITASNILPYYEVIPIPEEKDPAFIYEQEDNS